MMLAAKVIADRNEPRWVKLASRPLAANCLNGGCELDVSIDDSFQSVC